MVETLPGRAKWGARKVFSISDQQVLQATETFASDRFSVPHVEEALYFAYLKGVLVDIDCDDSECLRP